jgi:hypothetical protein
VRTFSLDVCDIYYLNLSNVSKLFLAALYLKYIYTARERESSTHSSLQINDRHLDERLYCAWISINDARVQLYQRDTVIRDLQANFTKERTTSLNQILALKMEIEVMKERYRIREESLEQLNYQPFELEGSGHQTEDSAEEQLRMEASRTFCQERGIDPDLVQNQNIERPRPCEQETDQSTGSLVIAQVCDSSKITTTGMNTRRTKRVKRKA